MDESAKKERLLYDLAEENKGLKKANAELLKLYNLYDKDDKNLEAERKQVEFYKSEINRYAGEVVGFTNQVKKLKQFRLALFVISGLELLVIIRLLLLRHY